MMGNYLPAGPKKQKSVSDTLLEAEEDHLLDCPDADLSARAAAFILDGIFCYLCASGLHHSFNALAAHLSHLPATALAGDYSTWQWLIFTLSKNAGLISAYLEMASKIALLYFYFVWTTAYARGTPAKLLFGLRVADVRTGESLGFPQAFFRELIAKPLGLFLAGTGILVAFVRKDRRTLHDILSQSVVKKVHGVR